MVPQVPDHEVPEVPQVPVVPQVSVVPQVPEVPVVLSSLGSSGSCDFLHRKKLCSPNVGENVRIYIIPDLDIQVWKCGTIHKIGFMV